MLAALLAALSLSAIAEGESLFQSIEQFCREAEINLAEDVAKKDWPIPAACTEKTGEGNAAKIDAQACRAALIEPIQDPVLELTEASADDVRARLLDGIGDRNVQETRQLYSQIDEGLGQLIEDVGDDAETTIKASLSGFDPNSPGADVKAAMRKAAATAVEGFAGSAGRA
jgi:hypothetical protein